ncbi:MAG: c-type cytochrome [Thermoanaerobaculia bacterium]|nr:c-type cytochrome [Thermoanaerobaculia bacterium]MCZ7651967.1 cytochrome c [Thermoanaerobaculia bacterium]
MREKQRKSTGRGTILAVGLLAAVALVAGWSAASGQEGEPVYSAFNGKVSYKVYCMNCHGVGGKGDGYLADSLKAKPTDLTAMAVKNGGEFPFERAMKSVDGRTPGHGSREMPVWGDAFLWPEDNPERRAEVQQKIGDLVEYLRSIQEPPVAK